MDVHKLFCTIFAASRARSGIGSSQQCRQYPCQSVHALIYLCTDVRLLRAWSKKENATSTSCEAANNLDSSPHQLPWKYNFSLCSGKMANRANLINVPMKFLSWKMILLLYRQQDIFLSTDAFYKWLIYSFLSRINNGCVNFQL